MYQSDHFLFKGQTQVLDIPDYTKPGPGKVEEEYPDELVDDEENNGSVAEEVLLDDKGEDPLGEKGELGREAEHTVVVEVTSTNLYYRLHNYPLPPSPLCRGGNQGFHTQLSSWG